MQSVKEPDRHFEAVLKGKAKGLPPVWLMRQAGRYLPEYRDVRARAGGFLDLCYSPAFATEVTLQPIRRFGFDAAILFSDILIVPHALGQKVTFEEGEGPRLDPITRASELSRLTAKDRDQRFSLVFEAVERIRASLPAETSLIGFCGAPWTVATYMVGGSGSPDQAAARGFAYQDPAGFGQLIDLLVATSIDYLSGQVAAGADVLQVFDSWAGSLPEDEFERWVIQPTARIVAGVAARHPGVPVIGFPRGAAGMAQRYLAETGVTAIGCDTAMPLQAMRKLQSEGRAVQGNLDPLLLVAGGAAMDQRIGEIVSVLAGKPFIFNLGHGIVPQTPPEHVARLVEAVRSAAATKPVRKRPAAKMPVAGD